MKLEIEVISPVHIGDGERLRLNLDFVWRGGKVQIIDLERLFSSFPPERLTPDLSRIPDNLLSQFILRTYPLRQPPREIYTFIKTLERPYIPGSSIKGAFRTAFAQVLFPEDFDLLSLPKDRRRAARPIEERIFGRTAYEDAFKQVRVSDARFEGEERVEIAEVGVYEATDGSLKQILTIYVEVIPEGAKLVGEISAPSVEDLFLCLNRKAEELIKL